MNLDTFNPRSSDNTSMSPAVMNRAMDEAHKAHFEIDLDRLGASVPGRRVPASVMALSAMASLEQMMSSRHS